MKEKLLKDTNVKTSATVYGKIEGDFLSFKGKYYKILQVAPDCLFLDSNKFLGRHGDEFPLDLIK